MISNCLKDATYLNKFVIYVYIHTTAVEDVIFKLFQHIARTVTNYLFSYNYSPFI